MALDSDPDPYPEDESTPEDESEEDESEEDEEQESSEIDHEDYQEVRDVSSPIPINTTVSDAIVTAPLHRLQSLLKDIIQRVPEAHAIASQKLLVSAATGVKRKAHETCRNCDNEYDVTDNHTGDCVYHEGEKEVDYESDIWADHDPRCHGEPRELYDDSTYDDGFTWTCCDQLGSADGCVISKHQPEEVVVAKRQILTPVFSHRG